MPIHHPLGFKQHPLEDAGIYYIHAKLLTAHNVFRLHFKDDMLPKYRHHGKLPTILIAHEARHEADHLGALEMPNVSIWILNANAFRAFWNPYINLYNAFVASTAFKIIPPPKFNSSPLKIDGWKTPFLLGS